MTALHALNGPDHPTPATNTAGQNTVKARLTPKRARRLTENDDYAAFTRRILRAYARRVADGDIEALTLMLGLSAEIDTAIGQAVTGLRAYGYSWADIGSRLGITRQAAQQRWGQHRMTAATAAPDPGPFTTGPGPGATADDTPHADFGRWEHEFAADYGCSHPIQLNSRTDMIDLATGELAPLYGTASTACGNRREAVCPVLLGGVQAGRPPARPRGPGRRQGHP